MTDSMPPEGQQPLTQAQARQLRRSLTEKILERAESDPQWKQLYLDDPELAMREDNFPEAQELREQGAPQEEAAEVMGQGEVTQRYGTLDRSVPSRINNDILAPANVGLIFGRGR